MSVYGFILGLGGSAVTVDELVVHFKQAGCSNLQALHLAQSTINAQQEECARILRAKQKENQRLAVNQKLKERQHNKARLNQKNKLMNETIKAKNAVKKEIESQVTGSFKKDKKSGISAWFASLWLKVKRLCL